MTRSPPEEESGFASSDHGGPLHREVLDKLVKDEAGRNIK